MKECATNNWLYDSSNSQRTIILRAENTFYVFSINTTGSLNVNGASNSNNVVRTVVYLRPDFKYCSGKGTSSDSFLFQTPESSCPNREV